MHKSIAAGVIALAPMLAAGQSAVAAGPQSVALVAATTFDLEPDDITSAAGALGVACTGGTTTDSFFHAGPDPDKWGNPSGKAQLRVGKVFHCTGGDFNASLSVELDLATQMTSGTWVITSGTGDFAHLRGHGSIVGVPFDGGIEDRYTGVITGT